MKKINGLSLEECEYLFTFFKQFFTLFKQFFTLFK
jgi:hypothetical protein